jgi:hypothetical protein
VLVGGFLSALVDGDNDYFTARQFLAPGTSWNASSGITLYDASTVTITRSGPSEVEVSVHRVGIIDPKGSYRSAPGSLHLTLGVVRVGGQWRITSLRAGVLLSTADAQRSLQPVALYYLNRTQTRLVPDPILVSAPAQQPGLATTLIGNLLAGPSRALAPAVETAVPPGTSLVGNVLIDGNGVAEINLAGSVEPSTSQAQQLSAQIVWTLRQLPSVKFVRLVDNGAPLSATGVPVQQGIGAWPQFDPRARPTSFGALLSNQGHVLPIDRTVPGPLLVGELFAPAVSADGSTVAALQRAHGETTLLVSTADGSFRRRLTEPSLSAPTFDPQGDVVIVSGTGKQSTIIEVPPDGRQREVDVHPEISQLGISAVALSRDGSRIAMVVGPPGRGELVVGAVSVTSGALVINGGLVVIPASQDVAGVAWAGANQIATTVRVRAAQRAVVETTVDGYTETVITSAGLGAPPTQVAAAPDQPLLAGAGGGIWSFADRHWTRVATGATPSYAG